MVEIRQLESNDSLGDLITLSREFFAEYEQHHVDFFKINELKDEHIAGYFASFLGNEKRAAFIAVEAEHFVGYITVYVKEQAEYWQEREVGEISGLMVSPEFRRGGVARKLLATAIEFFRSWGIRYFTVYTAVGNQAGVDFYTDCGLTPLYSTMMGRIP